MIVYIYVQQNNTRFYNFLKRKTYKLRKKENSSNLKFSFILYRKRNQKEIKHNNFGCIILSICMHSYIHMRAKASVDTFTVKKYIYIIILVERTGICNKKWWQEWKLNVFSDGIQKI